MEKQADRVICIRCPKGCRAEGQREGEKIRISGRLCKEGIAYVREEFTSPKRILTSTVRVANSPSRLLPVRTSGPIPRKDLEVVMAILARMEVKAPIRMGAVIVADVLGSQQDIIASDDLLH